MRILNATIAIGRDTFVRSSGDDVLFWNGRTEAARLIRGGAVLDGCIGKQAKRWEDIVHEIADKCQCSVSVADEDFWPIVEDMAVDGLVEIIGRTKKTFEEGYAPRVREVLGNANESIESIDFFKLHRLLAELHIDLTSACTERCVHCYLPDYPNRFLDYELVDKALTEFRQMQGLTVYLTGGECMLHPEFARICRRCRELDLNFIVMSNLTLCDEKMIRLLKETDPQYVNVSLYSMDAMEHDAVTRREGSWQKTITAILVCEKAGVHVRLASPLLKENRRAFSGLKEFADSHHMHLMTDCCIVPRCDHSSDNIDHACSSQELEETLVQNKDIFDRGWRGGNLPDCDAKVCEIGDTRICLNSKGEYYPCDGMHGFVLGNVRTDSLEKVWRGEKLNELRALKNSDFEKCSSCEDRSFCKVCPAYNFNATGKLTETIPAQCELARVIHKVYGGM